MDPPQKIMGQFFFRWLFEAGNLNPLGVNAAHNAANGTILTTCIHGLEDNQQGMFILRIQDVL